MSIHRNVKDTAHTVLYFPSVVAIRKRVCHLRLSRKPEKGIIALHLNSRFQLERNSSLWKNLVTTLSGNRIVNTRKS